MDKGQLKKIKKSTPSNHPNPWFNSHKVQWSFEHIFFLRFNPTKGLQDLNTYPFVKKNRS